MKHKKETLYDCVYHVNLQALTKNPVQWSEVEELPICKIENGEEIKMGKTENETIKVINCPKIHVKAIIKHSALFNEKHKCTVLEYQKPIVSGSETKIWMFRVFPDGGIDTNDPSLDQKTLTDIYNQVEMRNRMFYPKNTKIK